MKKAFFLGGALVATTLAVTAVCWPIGVLIGAEVAAAALGSLIGLSVISTPTVMVTVISKKSAMINDYVGVLQVAILEATVWSKMATGESSKPSLADSVSPVISKLSQLWAGRKFGKSKLQAPSGLPKSSGLSSGPVLKPSQPSPEPPAPAESVAELENLLVEALEPLGIHLHLSTSRKIALLWLYAVSLLRCDVRKPWSFHLSSTTQLTSDLHLHSRT